MHGRRSGRHPASSVRLATLIALSPQWHWTHRSCQAPLSAEPRRRRRIGTSYSTGPSIADSSPPTPETWPLARASGCDGGSR
eukprot:scaffold172769_cov26-Tisochrysis_lutea.AAC.1